MVIVIKSVGRRPMTARPNDGNRDGDDHGRPATEPSNDKMRKALWSHVRVLLVLGGILVVVVGWLMRRQNHHASDVGAAERVVEKVSTTPSTIEFLGGRLAGSDGPWRVVALEYDAQNEFGATVRHRDCVTFRWADGGRIEWSRALAVQACDVDSPRAEIVQLLIATNRTALGGH